MSGIRCNIITRENCMNAIQSLRTSEEYLEMCMKSSGLESFEIQSNRGFAKLICAALGTANKNKNIDKILKVCSKHPVSKLTKKKK